MKSLSLSLLLLLLCGCGYQFGSLMHPQIKTIYVARAENDTLAYNAAFMIRSLLCETLMTDGSLKVVNQGQADCELYCRVQSVSYQMLSESSYGTLSDIKIPDQWSCKAQVSYALLIPGRGKTLKQGVVTGTSSFSSGTDLQIARGNALHQALFQAARLLTTQITAW